mmetsp:Transcript_29881/g.79524  ORF Transcript_29881/g.79524 Transcript_29881/m.79524 type:complete len:282 (-) Transcript_29881:333-1178(-)
MLSDHFVPLPSLADVLEPLQQKVRRDWHHTDAFELVCQLLILFFVHVDVVLPQDEVPTVPFSHSQKLIRSLFCTCAQPFRHLSKILIKGLVSGHQRAQIFRQCGLVLHGQSQRPPWQLPLWAVDFHRYHILHVATVFTARLKQPTDKPNGTVDAPLSFHSFEVVVCHGTGGEKVTGAHRLNLLQHHEVSRCNERPGLGLGVHDARLIVQVLETLRALEKWIQLRNDGDVPQIVQAHEGRGLNHRLAAHDWHALTPDLLLVSTDVVRRRKISPRTERFHCFF